DDGSAGGGAPLRATYRLRRQGGDLGTERGDVTEQRRRRTVVHRIAEDGLRIVANPAMKRGQSRRQLRMAVRRRQQIVHQRDRGDADGDRGTTLHSRLEDLVRSVDLLDGDYPHGIAGEDRGIGAVAVEQSGGVHAQADPDGEGGEEQIARLGEQGDDDYGCRDADDGGD